MTLSTLHSPLSALLFLFILHPSSLILAQNMPHEAGVLFATNGQISLIAADNVNRGFYTNPTIEHVYYSFASNGLQSLSLFIEHVDETRGWGGVWSNPLLNGNSSNLQANVAERLHMTTLGLETIRTLLSESGFRIGVGIGLGFGFGGATARVTNVTTDSTEMHDSFSTWEALLLTAQLRVRYSLFAVGDYDIGLMLAGRYWGFPFIGPSGPSGGEYNGPGLRVLSEFGYLGGIAVGF